MKSSCGGSTGVKRFRQKEKTNSAIRTKKRASVLSERDRTASLQTASLVSRSHIEIDLVRAGQGPSKPLELTVPWVFRPASRVACPSPQCIDQQPGLRVGGFAAAMRCLGRD